MRGGTREVATLAWPVILSQISMTTMGIIDSAMVGRLGATELASVGFAGIWGWTCFNLFFGTSSAVQTFVSQAHGAGDERSCGGWVWQALYVLIPATAVTSVALVYWIEPFLSLLSPSAEMQEAAASYLRPRLAGSVGLLIAMTLTSFFRGFGDTRTPMYAAFTANAVNAVLDYGLIFGEFGLPEMGLVGAGIATAIGEWLYAAVLLVAFLRAGVRERFDTRPIAPDRLQLRRLLRIGVPIGGEWVLGMLSFAVFSTIIARMGDAAMAASQAVIILLSLSFMQAIGISAAGATLVGRYIGAQDKASARRSFASSVKMAGFLGVLIASVYIAVPEALMRIFSDDPEVIALGRPLIALCAAFQLFDAFGIVANGCLRGAGDTRWPFVVHTVLAWALFVPATHLLGVTLGFGLEGAWVGGTLYVGVLSSILLWRFNSGAWEELDIRV